MSRAISRLRSWSPSLVVFTLALAVYLSTAPRGLTWAHDSADGGDLIAAALVGGVPHPTGYPTYLLLARLALHLPWGTPAWRVTLLSMVSGALAAALVTATLGRLNLAKALAPHRPPERQSSPPLFPGPLPAMAAGLLLAFTPLLWGQSTVAEVYGLSACLAAGLVWLLAQWSRQPDRRWAAGAGLVMGLAMGNHLTAAGLLPLAAGALVGGRRRHRLWAVFIPALVTGLAVYLYLPLAAGTHPAVNWGNPTNPSRFWWLVSGQLYRHFVFAVSWADAWARLQAWAGLLFRDFWPWGVALALAGLAISYRRERLATACALASLGLLLAWAIGYDTSDSLLILTPAWVVIAVWLGLGLAHLVGWMREHGRSGQVLAAGLCLVLVLLPLARYWPRQDLSQDRQAEDFVAHVMESIATDGLLITAGDRATFSLWYARYGLSLRPDLALVSRDLWGLASYRQTVGQVHPLLGGSQPPQELADLVQTVAMQRSVYLAQPGPAAALSDFGLEADAPFWLQRLPGPDDAPVLWRLRPLATP